MATNTKGPHNVTAKIDAETRETLDEDSQRIGDFRADRIRDALGIYLELRRGEWVCPHCNDPVQYEPEP
jgi:hypothetical protein